MSEKSSYWYDSSPVKATSNEILYVGKTVDCLDFCDKPRLTTVQEKILDKICELVGITDVTSIHIPTCLVEAWGTSDETILNFLQFLLDQHCSLKSTVDELPTTNNPFVTISYCCCNDETGCNTQVTLTLSDHIQKILNCLCDLKDEVATLTALVDTLASKTQITELQTQITCLKSAITTWNISTLSAFNSANPDLTDLGAIDVSTC